MSTHLFLLRHAKSDWNVGSLSDFERPLSERGMQEAPSRAAALAEKYAAPALWLVSPAVRTYQTACVFARVWGQEGARFQLVPELFHASAEAIRQLALDGIRRNEGSVIIVGHNPGLSLVLSDWTGKSCDMKTAATGVLAFDSPTADPRLVAFLQGGKAS